MAIDWGAELGGNSPQQSQGSVASAIENNPGVAAQYAAIDRLQHAKDVTKRYIDQMGQTSSETPGGIFGRKVLPLMYPRFLRRPDSQMLLFRNSCSSG